MPGRVDLWPLIEKASSKDEDDWRNPVDLITEEHHTARLAEQIAAEIDQMIRVGASIPEKHGSRPVHAGDFLILVQRTVRPVFRNHPCLQGAQTAHRGGGPSETWRGTRGQGHLLPCSPSLPRPKMIYPLPLSCARPLCGWTEAELYALAQPRNGLSVGSTAQPRCGIREHPCPADRPARSGRFPAPL